MKKKYYLIIWTIIIITTIIISIIIRSSYISNDINDYSISEFECEAYNLEINERYSTETKISSYEDLNKVSDFVVIVSPQKIEKQQFESMVSKVSVEKVFKGSKLIQNKDIYFYDTCYFGFKYKFFRPIGCSGIIKLDKKYLLFLKKDKKNNEDIYYLATKSVLSKFCIQNNDLQAKLLTDKTNYLKNYKDFDILTSEKEDIKRYKKLRDEIFYVLNIN